MRRALSLEVLRVENPCTQPWDAMRGDGRTRFCEGCQLHVHNLSAMPRDEAERLVCEASGRLCVRYEVAADGAVMTLDYQEPRGRRGGWRFWTAIGAVGALLAGAAQAIMSGRQQQTVMIAGAITRPVTVAPVPVGRADPTWRMGSPATGVVMGDVASGPAPAATPVDAATRTAEQAPPAAADKGDDGAGRTISAASAAAPARDGDRPGAAGALAPAVD